jgi:hypothetical protein
LFRQFDWRICIGSITNTTIALGSSSRRWRRVSIRKAKEYRVQEHFLYRRDPSLISGAIAGLLVPPMTSRTIVRGRRFLDEDFSHMTTISPLTRSSNPPAAA